MARRRSFARGHWSARQAIPVTVLAALALSTSPLLTGAAHATTWTSDPVRAPLPAGALTTHQTASFNAVGCSSANTCTAVGSFRTNAGNQLLVSPELNGEWLTPSLVTPPPNAIKSTATAGRVAELFGVACPALGACVAVGTYNTADGFEPVLATQSHGVWSTTQPRTPADTATSGQSAALFGVACNGVGNCEAVGTYDNTVKGLIPWSLSESRGVWHAPQVPDLPTDALTTSQDAGLTALSCPTFGNCVAVGSFFNNTDLQAMVLTETHGTWGPAATGATIALPANAATTGNDTDNGLNAVACLALTSCVAVGQYNLTSGVAAMATTESSGTWHDAHEIVTPTPLDTVNAPLATLASVACTSVNTCVAVGGFGTNTETQSLDVSDTDGTWSSGTVAPLPPDATNSASGPDAQLLAVTTFGLNEDEVVGQYQTSNGVEAYRSIPTTAPGSPTAVEGILGNTVVHVLWSDPLYSGGTALTGYVVTSSPGDHTCTTVAALTCTVSGLTNGVTYTFTVTAANSIGVSTPSAPSATVTPATRPSAPDVVTVRSFTKGVQLILRAPTANGGAAIVTYEYSLDGGRHWRHRATGTTSRILTITHLLARHAYDLAVRAVNVVGPGPKSNVVRATTK
jgi:hypothetical protein